MLRVILFITTALLLLIAHNTHSIEPKTASKAILIGQKLFDPKGGVPYLALLKANGGITEEVTCQPIKIQ